MWEKLGQLSGPELEAPGGRRYRAGDRVITLAPAQAGRGSTRSGRWCNLSTWTSALWWPSPLRAPTAHGARRHRGRQARLQLRPHRPPLPGATVDATYALEDGGGRELAYVAMSRARGESHVHVVAPNPAEAAQRVAWAWGHERRQAWVLDQERRRQVANLYIERQELRASVPPDCSADLGQARRQLANAEQDAAELRAGTGRWAYSPASHAARALHQADAEHQRAAHALVGEPRPLGKAQGSSPAARNISLPGKRPDEWERTGQPYGDQLETVRDQLATKAAQLEEAQRARDTFLAEHPEVPARLADLDRAIEVAQELGRRQHWDLIRQPEQVRHLGLSQEIDNGYGIDL